MFHYFSDNIVKAWLEPQFSFRNLILKVILKDSFIKHNDMLNLICSIEISLYNIIKYWKSNLH